MGFFGKLARFVTLRIAEGIVVILLIAFMPNLPPYCKISDSRTITPSLPLEGKLALNNRLDNVEILHKGRLQGPEGFADYNGELYTSLLTGEIVKLTGDKHITPVVKFGKPCKGIYQEKICGRPLGMAFDKDGYLIAADAYYGIFRVNVKTGDQVQLVSMDVEINGKKPKLPNSIAIASNGDIFWSDSSTEFYLEDGLIDTLSDGSGRLIHYNVRTKQNTVLIDNLLFANGVALSKDEDFVIVVESIGSAIHRYYLKGPKAGTKDIFIDGLPGLPDNLTPDGKGGFFAPLIYARDADNPLPNQFLAPWPIIRRVAARILGLTEFGFKLIQKVYPNEFAEKAIHFIGHFTSLSGVLPKRVTILHLSPSGEIIQSWHTTKGKISSICEMHLFNGYVYLGSPFNDYIARISIDALGGLDGYGKITQKKENIPPPKVEKPKMATEKPKATTEKPTTTTKKPTVEKPVTTEKPTEKPTTQKPIEKPTTQKPTEKPKVVTEKPKVVTEKPKPTTEKPKVVTEIPKPETPTTTKPVAQPKNEKPKENVQKPSKTVEKTKQPEKKVENSKKEATVKEEVKKDVPKEKVEVKKETKKDEPKVNKEKAKSKSNEETQKRNEL